MDEMLKDLYELCEMYGDWLHEAKEKVRRSGKTINATDADYLDKLTHSLKSIKTTVAMMESEDDGGYSGRYYSRNNGYSYDGENMRGNSRRDGYSGRRRDSMGRYSRTESNSDDFKEQLMELMENAPDDKARREVERVVSRIS